MVRPGGHPGSGVTPERDLLNATGLCRFPRRLHTRNGRDESSACDDRPRARAIQGRQVAERSVQSYCDSGSTAGKKGGENDRHQRAQKATVHTTVGLVSSKRGARRWRWRSELHSFVDEMKSYEGLGLVSKSNKQKQQRCEERRKTPTITRVICKQFDKARADREG